jgi:hypothetical protein
MNNKAITFLMFVFGAAIGSVVTLQIVRKKYEQIAQEEIDSVKEVFSKRETTVATELNDTNVRVKAEQAKEKPGVVEYAAKLQRHWYTNYSNGDIQPVEQDKPPEIKPYVISPEEFGELDYDKIGLSYYADQILADENDELIEDVDGVVGFESLSHFGEYEDDSVFVRNDRLKCDYEILLDQRKYSEIAGRKPHHMED